MPVEVTSAHRRSARLAGYGDLDPGFTRVTGTGDHAVGSAPIHLVHPEATDLGGFGEHGGQALLGPWPLDGQHGTIVGGLGAADGCPHPVRVGGVGHDIEDLVGDPPDDDVVEHRGVGLVEKVGVLGPTGSDPGEVVGEGVLEAVQGVGALDPHRAEVRHVEDHRVVAAGHVLVEGAGWVGDGHLPAAEGHHLRPQFAVDRVERAEFACHHHPTWAEAAAAAAADWSSCTN